MKKIPVRRSRKYQQRPHLMPVVDGEPIPMRSLEHWKTAASPKDEFDGIRHKYDLLKEGGEISFISSVSG